MRLSPAARDLVRAALTDEKVQARYWAKVARPPHPPVGVTCWYWVGSLHPKGHGRFWVGNLTTERGPHDVCVIAHRFGWALAHGFDALEDADVLAHTCDEPSCQNPEHLSAATWSQNLAEWQRRRWAPTSPLRDRRGPGGRAQAIRRALLAGQDLTDVFAEGLTALDRDQLELF